MPHPNTNQQNSHPNPLPTNGMRYQDFLAYTRLPASERETFAKDLARRREQMFPMKAHKATGTIAPSAIEPFDLCLLYTGSDAAHELRQEAEKELEPEQGTVSEQEDVVRAGTRAYRIQELPGGGKGVAASNRYKGLGTVVRGEKRDDGGREVSDQREGSVTGSLTNHGQDRGGMFSVTSPQRRGLDDGMAPATASDSGASSSSSSASERDEAEPVDSDGEWLPEAD